jgi:hypothetical protein
MQTRAWAFILLLSGLGPAAAQDVQNPSFYLVNRSPWAISRVFATPTGQSNWGQNRLVNAIPPAGNSAIRLPADGKCIYDIRVTYANGRAEERHELNTCEVDNLTFSAGREAAARPSEDPSFVLINRGRSPVNELYLSVTDDDSWGQDRLGEDNVPRGATKVIRLPPGECVYDVRVVFANGEASEKRRLNLCQINNLRVP